MSGDHASAPVAARVRTLEARLIEAGLITDDAVDRVLAAFLDRADPHNGARIVARAWTDADFGERVLADGTAALLELGFDTKGRDGKGYRLKVVRNTPERHNVVVCTLCSCYPVSLLGPSPGWYKSLAYRSRVVREPRAVLAEFGLELPGEVDITVWDSSAETRYLVIPVRPPDTEHLDEAALADLVTRDGLIGVAAV
ncbi:MAG: nitrile hydratase subunit alpha [Streptosporangiales bacterium]|nr:nitrile hydratase subunit alpha [Streptosporangiales bacterium]